MDWLLKVVEGPMKGAEIALVGGMCVTVGRDEGCDIVIADQSLGATAFKLDVADSGVTLLGPADAVASLNPFEIHTFGATAFAVGPAEGEWEELRQPTAAEESAGPDEAEIASPSEETPAAVESETPPAPQTPIERLKAKVAALPKKILYAALAAAGLLFVVLVVLFASLFSSSDDLEAKAAAAAQAALADIASAHGLTLTNCAPPAEKRSLLTGNLKLRTERLAIRALALSADPKVKLDLTDDETLLSSANALLYVVTDGAVKATVASNRMVKLVGAAESRDAFTRVVEALKSDVPCLRSIDVSEFVVNEVGKKDETKPAAAIMVVEAKSGEKPSDVPAQARAVAVSVKSKTAERKRPEQPDLPIAGILTVPYPCIVLSNGQRILEGAQIGPFVIDRIASDRIVLKLGDTRVEWRP